MMGSKRSTFLLLGLVLIVPALFVGGHVTVDFRHFQQSQKNELGKISHHIDIATGEFFEKYTNLLLVVSKSPCVVIKDTETCGKLFSDLNKKIPHAVNFAAHDRDGFFFASGRPFNKQSPPSVRHLEFYEKIMQGAERYIMTPHTGPISGEKVTGISIPLRNPSETIIGGIGVSIQFRALENLWEEFVQTSQNSLIFFDRAGTIHVASPLFKENTGKMLSALSFQLKEFGQKHTGTVILASQPYLYHYQNLHDSSFSVIELSPRLGFFQYVAMHAYLKYFGAAIVFLFSIGLSFLLYAFALSSRLSRSEQELYKWTGMIKKASWPVIVADANRNTIEMLNPAAAALYGYTVEEMIGRPVTSLYSPAELASLNTVIEVVHERGHYTFETLHVRKDGSIFPVLINASAVRDSGGKIRWRAATVEDITERKKTEEKLQISEERLRLAVANGSVGLWEWDVATNQLEWNEQLKIIFGLPISASGLTLEMFLNSIHPDDLAETEKYFRTALEQQTEFHHEYRIIWPDNSVHWIVAIGRGFYDRAGQPIRMMGGALDITERKQADEALRESEAFIRAVMDSLPIGIAVNSVDPNVKFTYMNDNFPKIYRTTRKALAVPNAFWDAVYEEPDFREKIRKRVLDDCLSGDPERMHWVDVPITRRGKETAFITAMNMPVPDKRLMISIVWDVTHRKQAENALLASEMKYRNLLENIQLVAVILDMNGNIAFCNDYLLNLTGWSREDVLNRNWFDLFLPADERDAVKVIFKANITDGTVLHNENSIITRDGNLRTIVWNIAVLHNSEGNVTGTASIGVDVTDQRKLEEQLLQAQKMEAIGQLAGGIAHDFNNMLQVIMHYAALLKLQGEKSPRQEEFLDGIVSTSLRAAELTQGLLAYSRKQRLNLNLADINDIILDTEKMLRRLIGEDIALVARLCPKPLIAMVDAGQIQQMLINLATNARDSMPRGGSLTISTDIGQASEEFQALRDFDTSANYAYISVKDTGEGMDEATRARIFDPFFTTKEVGKGTGLGLAIVYGIVKQHGGIILCRSQKGSGTTFTIELPLSKGEKAYSGGKKTDTVSQGKETILLAEDEDVVRKATKLVLESAGYRVLTAADGHEAIELYRKNRDIIDLLLMDVVMPRCNGKEAYEEIRRINPDAAVCFISGYADDVISNRVTLEGNFQCIAKPISPEELLRRIREILDSSS